MMKFATRQIRAVREIPKMIEKTLRYFFTFKWKAFAASFLVVFQLLGAFLFDTPITPHGEKLDLSKFELVWQDDFDHGFDEKTWEGHYVYSANDTQKRDTAYWNRDQVSFTDDGCLKLTVEYRDGAAGMQYYSYGMDTNPSKHYIKEYEGYEQLYGYFETRCILPKGPGINPAFWLLTDGMWADDTDGGVSGCEIDVFETDTDFNKRSPFFNTVYHTIHIDSYEEAHRSEMLGSYYADDPYNKFNTYGVLWDKDGYVFYINGVETARTSFGGVCEVPLYLILSLGVNDRIKENTFLPSSMVVDYVKAYQPVSDRQAEPARKSGR
ncbi:MAG: glycoside hydrolase family 16 protein [Clostridiales bacterium]|nr:glycoside hydrolase family 16 protein [Clostridiales bacterium]